MRKWPALFIPLLLVVSACTAGSPSPTATDAVDTPGATEPASETGSAEPTQPTEMETVVVTSGGVCICHAPLFVGIERGIFEAHGIEIEVMRVASGFEGLSALQTGDADVADAVVAVVAQAASQGVEATAVLMANGDPTGTVDTDDYFAIVARPDAGIGEGRIEDLAGKTIGVATGTIAHQYLFFALEAAGMDAEQDVEIQHVSPPDLASALQSGSIDALASWEPVALQALANVDGAVEVKRGGGHIEYLFQRWISPQFISERPETVKRFVEAFAEAAQFVRQNQDESVEILTESFEGLDAETISTALGYLNFDPRYSQSSQESIEQGLAFARDFSGLESDYEFADHLDLSFLGEVEAEHPEYFEDLPQIPEDLQAD